MSRRILVLCPLLMGILLFSCARDASVKRELDKAAAGLKAEMAAVEAGVLSLSREAERVYAEEGDKAAAVALDESEGGFLRALSKNAYYYKPEREGAAYYVSPWLPADEGLKTRIRFLRLLEPAMLKAANSSTLVNVSFLGLTEGGKTAVIIAPWYDIPAVFPPGIDLGVFEWYRRGLAAKDSARWSDLPFADLGTGWVVDVCAGVSVQGETKAVAVLSVTIDMIERRYLRGSEIALLLLSADSTLLGISPRGGELSGLKALDSVRLLDRMKENLPLPADAKLDSPTRPEAEAELGRRLTAGEDGFRLGLNGHTLRVYSRREERSGLILAALAGD